MPWIDENFHVTFGPEAHKMPSEQLRAEIEKVRAEGVRLMDEHEQAARALDGLPYAAVPLDQLADIYERFCRLIPLGQTDIRKWDEDSEQVRKLKRAIFDQADFGALYAGQWLPKEIRKQVREKVRAELKAAEESPTLSQDPTPHNGGER